MKKRYVIFIAFLVTLFGLANTAFATTEDRVQAASNAYYLHENSNVDTIHATTVGALPCIGEARVLVFYTDFLNGDQNCTKTVEEINDLFFSEAAKNDSSLAYTAADSLRSFYYRSSYGKVDITGTVYEYQTQQDTSCYASAEAVFDEIIEHYRDIINWDDYDANRDGYIDGLYLIARNRHSFGGPNFVGVYSNTVDNVKIGKACFLDAEDLSTIAHETCHMFGPADMYAGVSVNPNGVAVDCIMNGIMRGDLPSPTKFVLGWLDNAVFVDSNGAETYELQSYENNADVLIIYPNGDTTNRNWFFVEYMTQGSNNPLNGKGIRVWRTQMNLDEYYNISGSTEFCYGMPNSPYEYLEAVHPDGVENYCLDVGEELTPYGYPSTAYSDTFLNEGGAKFLKDLTFSGINIEFTGVQDETARVHVVVEDTPQSGAEVQVGSTIITPDVASAFLDSIDRYHLATITASAEITATGKASLICVDGSKTIPLYYAPSKNKTSFCIYIDPAYLVQENMAQYNIVLPTVSTYYGKVLDIPAQTETVFLDKIPVPYQELSEDYNTVFSMSDSYDLTLFQLTDDRIMTVYLDEYANKLFWGEFDLSQNTTTAFELDTPTGMHVSGTNDGLVVWEDGAYYYVYLDGFVCCYQDRKLVNYLDTSSVAKNMKFCGADGHSFFISALGMVLYEMNNNGKEITFSEVSAINDHADVAAVAEVKEQLCLTFYGMTREVYDFGGTYLINISGLSSYNHMYLVGDTVTQMESGNANSDCAWVSRSIKVVGNKIYVFEGGKDLVLRVYDKSFKQVKECTVLSNLGVATWGPCNQSVEYVDGTWVVSFESVSNSNAISYSSTFAVTCDMNGNVLNYYRYGDATYRYVCQIVPLSKNELVCITPFHFHYIGTGEEPTDPEPTEPEPTDPEPTDPEPTDPDDIPEEEQAVPGNLDGNDVVDEDDVIYLLQHLLMPDDFTVTQTVDYDKSGSIDEDDVIYLLQHLLMPEDFPLKSLAGFSLDISCGFDMLAGGREVHCLRRIC